MLPGVEDALRHFFDARLSPASSLPLWTRISQCIKLQRLPPTALQCPPCSNRHFHFPSALLVYRDPRLRTADEHTPSRPRMLAVAQKPLTTSPYDPGSPLLLSNSADMSIKSTNRLRGVCPQSVTEGAMVRSRLRFAEEMHLVKAGSRNWRRRSLGALNQGTFCERKIELSRSLHTLRQFQCSLAQRDCQCFEWVD